MLGRIKTLIAETAYATLVLATQPPAKRERFIQRVVDGESVTDVMKHANRLTEIALNTPLYDPRHGAALDQREIALQRYRAYADS